MVVGSNVMAILQLSACMVGCGVTPSGLKVDVPCEFG